MTSGAALDKKMDVMPYLTNAAEGEAWGVGLAELVSTRLFNVHGLQVVTPRAETVPADSNFANSACSVRSLTATTAASKSSSRAEATPAPT